MATNWKFVLTDFQGNALGQVLNAHSRTVTRALSAPSTAGFTIGVDNARAQDVLSKDCCLKAYRDDAIIFHGNMITSELAGDDATATPLISCTFADPAWRFDHRVVGQSANGTLYNGTDRLTIFLSELGTQNGLYSGLGSTQILPGSQTCGSTAVYTVGPYKKLSEVLADLGNTLSGFDWRIDPTEPIAGSQFPWIGQFYGAAVLGTVQTGAVFEYQGRGNAREPHYIRDISTSANLLISIPDDGPTSNLGVRTALDATFAPWIARGVLEEVVDTSGITNSTLRDAVLNDHLLYRKNPRQIVSFTPDIDDLSGRVPKYGVDYAIGDYVRCRINYGGANLVDGYVRLYKMQFEIDDNNRETLTPTVVSET